MSTRSEKKFEKIQQLLEKLEKEADRGTTIVIEGKKDAKALSILGINGNTILAKSGGKSFLDVLREIERKKERQVILLLDFDRRGKEWSKRLATSLEEMKKIPNLIFWRRILNLVGHEVKDIEGLPTYLEKLKTKF